MAWYSDSYRRHLADMHIEDWNDEFLRDFDPQTYADNLKKAHIQTAMIYIHSHVGYNNYQTESGHAHRKMDVPYSKIQELVDICHKEGMTVVAYYSLTYNTWAHDTHPEWRMVNKEGLSMRQRIPHYRYGFCCPNNEDYLQFTYKQIDEFAKKFKVEGIFYDMLFWEDVCYCPSCQKKFKEETGHEIPEEMNWHDPLWKKFEDCRCRWMGEFAKKVADHTKAAMPGVTVEHNFASAVSGDWRYASAEFTNESCDYTGGDFCGVADAYDHSFTAKYYYNVTNNQPFEYMTGRCQIGLSRHTLTKAERALRLEMFLAASHHGSSLFIDAVDPKGTLDTRVYDRLGNVFAEQMKYAPVFNRGEYLQEAAVFYSAAGRYNPDGDDEFNSIKCSMWATRRLIMNHIPVGVVGNAMKQDLAKYKIVLASGIAALTEKARKGLIEYVRNGGSLYFSGNGEDELLKAFFGFVPKGVTEANRTYVAPCEGYEGLFSEFTKDYPLTAFTHHAIVDPEQLDNDTKVLGKLVLPYSARTEDRFASIHSDPPGIWTDHPSMIYKEFGKGRVIWSALPFEAFEGWQFEDMMMAFIRFLGADDWSIRTDAAPGIELVSFKTEEGYLVSATDMLSYENDLNYRPISISVKSERPLSVKLLPDGEKIESEYADGMTTFTTPEIHQFAMFELE